MTEIPKSVRLVWKNGTVYAICPRCEMDAMWPSWCKCSPQRIYLTADLPPKPRKYDNSRRASSKVNASRRSD